MPLPFSRSFHDQRYLRIGAAVLAAVLLTIALATHYWVDSTTLRPLNGGWSDSVYNRPPQGTYMGLFNSQVGPDEYGITDFSSIMSDYTRRLMVAALVCILLATILAWLAVTLAMHSVYARPRTLLWDRRLHFLTALLAAIGVCLVATAHHMGYAFWLTTLSSALLLWIVSRRGHSHFVPFEAVPATAAAGAPGVYPGVQPPPHSGMPVQPTPLTDPVRAPGARPHLGQDAEKIARRQARKEKWCNRILVYLAWLTALVVFVLGAHAFRGWIQTDRSAVIGDGTAVDSVDIGFWRSCVTAAGGDESCYNYQDFDELPITSGARHRIKAASIFGALALFLMLVWLVLDFLCRNRTPLPGPHGDHHVGEHAGHPADVERHPRHSHMPNLRTPFTMPSLRHQLARTELLGAVLAMTLAQLLMAGATDLALCFMLAAVAALISALLALTNDYSYDPAAHSKTLLGSYPKTTPLGPQLMPAAGAPALVSVPDPTAVDPAAPAVAVAPDTRRIPPGAPAPGAPAVTAGLPATHAPVTASTAPMVAATTPITSTAPTTTTAPVPRGTAPATTTGIPAHGRDPVAASRMEDVV
eukprot:m.85251 g.85251  ORF g.85251 m.85251 type:complete len:585 (+) comp17859_c1_seq1:324-2078(+)